MQFQPDREVDAVAQMIMAVLNQHMQRTTDIYRSVFSTHPGLHYRVDILVIDDTLRIELCLEPTNTRSN